MISFFFFFFFSFIVYKLLYNNARTVCVCVCVFGKGLGDAWGAVTPANHNKEAIKELGSYLLQVNILKVIADTQTFIIIIIIIIVRLRKKSVNVRYIL